jgi:hypothetical protein
MPPEGIRLRKKVSIGKKTRTAATRIPVKKPRHAGAGLERAGWIRSFSPIMLQNKGLF